MNVAAVSLGGGLVGLGVFCGALALAPRRARPGAPAGVAAMASALAGSVDQGGRRAMLALVGGVLFGLTGWPAAMVLGVAFGAVAPSVVGRRAARAQAIERLEALASWTESLRDLIVAGAAVESALREAAVVAPRAIHVEVTELSRRLANNESLLGALEGFAVDVADPVADLVVTALATASSGRGGGRVADVLSAAARAARAQVAMRLQVEAGRAGTYTSARVVTTVFVAFTAGLLLLNRDFLAPFGTPVGQLVILVIGTLFAVCVGVMVRLAEPEIQERFFGSDRGAGS